jgi:hypothetical protein
MRTKIYRYDRVEEEAEIIQVEVQLRDGMGREVNNTEAVLQVAVEGKGMQLLGIENGNLADNTDYTAWYRRTCRDSCCLS